MKRWILTLLLLLFLYLAPNPGLAFEQDQFVTIVNPVRVARYLNNPGVSLKAEYSQIQKRNLPATWLLTYDAILNEEIYETVSLMDSNQETGIFFEVTPKFAYDAHVEYNKTDSWHRANALFLSGYSQESRVKLIDKVFQVFKEKFGFYPVSVGGWWVDSFSLDYMQKKYGIIVKLGLADQFSTDGYQVWGQYWSTPFYPSKIHSGIPASDAKLKINVVNLQWAPRDPLNGYGGDNSSLYSSQDYSLLKLSDGYFLKLINLYLKKNGNSFGQVTIGLESDLSAEVYANDYARELDLLINLKEQNPFLFSSMGNFGKWYILHFPNLSPVRVIETDDFLNQPKKIIWYQSPRYRLGLGIDLSNYETSIFDLRVYSENFQEPFYKSPNYDQNLFINTPSLLDKASDAESKWLISKNETTNVENKDDILVINFESGKKLILAPHEIRLEKFGNGLPEPIKKSPLVSLEQRGSSQVITPKSQFIFDPNGYQFRELSIKSTYFMKTKKAKLALLLTSILISTIFLLILKINNKVLKLFLLFGCAVSLAFIISYIYLKNSQKYFVDQSQIDALLHLKSMPFGRVVVYDGSCLVCFWHTDLPPAIFGNKRSYVSKFSEKPIIYNLSIFNAKSREEGRKELQKLKVKYIYLAKFESYSEKLPFSPGDYNAELIYENSNAQIWRIK